MRASASGLQIGKRAGAAVLTGLLLWAPPPVKADDDWDDDDRRGRRHRNYEDDDRHHGGGRHHQHGDWCAPRHGHHKHGKHRHYRPPPPRYAGWGPGWYAPPRPVVYARYRCEPCGHWYDEEVAFHAHIHRHHHIAQAVIPLVIGAAAFGWIFYGH